MSLTSEAHIPALLSTDRVCKMNTHSDLHMQSEALMFYIFTISLIFVFRLIKNVCRVGIPTQACSKEHTDGEGGGMSAYIRAEAEA